jgi:hypothetical protein
MIRWVASRRIQDMPHRMVGVVGTLFVVLLGLVWLPGAVARSAGPGTSAGPLASALALASAAPGADAGPPASAVDPNSPAGRLVTLLPFIETDRLLLAELRKDIPDDRTEAEAYIAHVEDLALGSDPVRLGVIVSRVRAAAPAWLDWREQQYATSQEAATAYVQTGAAAFDASWGKLHDAALLTVIDRGRSVTTSARAASRRKG